MAQMIKQQCSMFFNALNRHQRLLELALDGTNIGRTGCTALANLLTNPESRIIKLRLEANDFDNYAITTFSNALRYRNTLVSLNFAGDLHEPSRITVVGWRAFASIFTTRTCSIEDFFLRHIRICNEGMASLVNDLAINGTLKYLHIGFGMLSLTPAGWKAIAMCVRNPDTNST